MSATRAVAVAVLLVGACRDASTPLQPVPRSGAEIPGQYIVVFRDTVPDPVALTQSLVKAQGDRRLHTYTSALKGFAARLSDATVAALRRDPLVAYVEPDQRVTVSGTQQMDANGDPWGLDRIDQRALPLDHTYTYGSTGAGVHVYLIDTGIWTPHAEFGGRADVVYDVQGLNGEDCIGHGTAVAGVVGAKTYGVAKGVLLHGVRVFTDCGFSTTISDVVAGIDWVTANHRSPAVANIPLDRTPSTALTTAIKSLWNSGVFVAVTAGNSNEDACLQQSGTSGAFVVAASTPNDAKADFSNWGPCVNIYAPGALIRTTWPPALPGTFFAVPRGDSTAMVQGTSFSAPHVTGVAALYKATFGDAPSDAVANWILNNATPGVITGNPAGTPNLLLFSPAGPPTTGNLTVSNSTTGTGAPSSYTVTVDAGTPSATSQAITPGGSVTFTGLAAGSHSVTLTVASNCTVTNTNPQTVTVSAGSTASASFTVSCTTPPTTGNLTVTTSTTGSSFPSGYTVTVDGSQSQAIGVNSNVTFTNLSASSHSVALTNVASNCTVSGSNPRTVTVPAGGTGSTTFSVSCTTPPGNLTVTTSTTGSSFPASYTLNASGPGGSGSQPIGVNTSVTFSAIATGDYTVSLSNVPTNCTVSGSNPRTVTVPAGGTGSTTFSVSCTTPPTTGNLTVSNSTTGSSFPSGYTVTVDGSQSQAIGVNSSVTFTSLSAGSHSVALTNVASNCTVSGSNPRTVTVPSGGTATTTFSVSCTTPNSPPVVSAGPNETQLFSLVYSLSASFSDPNNDGPWSYTISWGDGSSSSGSTSSQGTIGASHTYLLFGSYTITVTVTDSHGASGSGSKVVTFIL